MICVQYKYSYRYLYLSRLNTFTLSTLARESATLLLFLIILPLWSRAFSLSLAGVSLPGTGTCTCTSTEREARVELRILHTVHKIFYIRFRYEYKIFCAAHSVVPLLVYMVVTRTRPAFGVYLYRTTKDSGCLNDGL